MNKMQLDVLGCSVQGASHKHIGVECQDSFKKRELKDGTVILAVADGHGSKSCPHSKTGSSIAVNVFCSVMEELHDAYINDQDALVTFLNREGETKVAQSIDIEWKRRVLKAHKDNKRSAPLTQSGEKDKAAIYQQYGSTLVGLMIMPGFLFALQIGDGDIAYVDPEGFAQVVQSDKILGTETHSLSKMEAWKKAVSVVRRMDNAEKLSCAFLLSTDGFSNSFRDQSEYEKSCQGYYETIRDNGSKAVEAVLRQWLDETSEMGCGDDITLLIAYYGQKAESEVKDDG